MLCLDDRPFLRYIGRKWKGGGGGGGENELKL